MELGEQTNILIKIFTKFFLIIFTIVFFITTFFNKNDLVHFKMIRSFYIGTAILGALLLSFYVINKRRIPFNISKTHKKITILIIAFSIFLIQILFAKSIYFDIGWDVSAIINNSQYIVDNPAKFEYQYFKMYPNNIFLLIIFSLIYKMTKLFAISDYRFVLVIINIIIVDLSIIFTILSAKKILNNKSVITIACIFLLLFGLSPWIVVPYSDTLSMLFPILIFYLYLIKQSINSIWQKICLCIVIGVLASVAYQIKPTTIIVIIAILISELIYGYKSLKKIFQYIILVLIISSTFISTNKFISYEIGNLKINGTNLNDRYDEEFPFTHFIMMGLQEINIENRGTLYGAYVPEDVSYTASFKGKSEKVKANIQEIKSRLKEFGVLGYIEFLINKALWFLSDGTFYYGGEGNFMISDPYSNDNISKKIQNIFLFNGDNYKSSAYFFQGIWVLILFLIMYPIFEKEPINSSKRIFTIRLTIVGIIMFLVLFEARSRYLINHIPFFVLLAGASFNNVYIRFFKEIEKG